MKKWSKTHQRSLTQDHCQTRSTQRKSTRFGQKSFTNQHPYILDHSVFVYKANINDFLWASSDFLRARSTLLLINSCTKSSFHLQGVSESYIVFTTLFKNIWKFCVILSPDIFNTAVSRIVNLPP